MSLHAGWDGGGGCGGGSEGGGNGEAGDEGEEDSGGGGGDMAQKPQLSLQLEAKCGVLHLVTISWS